MQKSGGAVYQWNIMESMKVPREEIPSFADARHWLSYFPPRALVLCMLSLCLSG